MRLVYLGDRCVGRPPFVQQFPGSEPAPTLAEIEEIQRRLTALGFDTGGADGRIGNATTIAVRDYQRKFGIEPADGYPRRRTARPLASKHRNFDRNLDR